MYGRPALEKGHGYDIGSMMGVKHTFRMEVSFMNVLIREHDTALINMNYKMTPSRRLYFSCKRLFDILLSLAGLIILIIVFPFMASAIKIESKGPVIYKQTRTGLHGRQFTIYKFRTMYVDAEKEGPCWAQKNDPRVTKAGSFLRRTRIDEMPQFINILKGDMSFIGPRPERPCFTYQYEREIPGFVNRLQVKPGITGWAQVNGGYELSPKEKLDLDIFYLSNMSPLLDLEILIKTMDVLFRGKGAR
jgi:exopolysaccharide biosynthesis polyprenyl glycosylphosphotransferase